MPDRIRTAPPPVPLVASAALISRDDLTVDRTLLASEKWQDEGWGFYDSLGEFNYGIGWLSQSLSRVRVLAAEQVPGGDEPEPLTDGPAAEIMEQLGGGMGGRSAIMRSLGVQVGVPGEGWLVAQREKASTPLNLADWSVCSTQEIRPSGVRGGSFDVRAGDNVWNPLPPESLVCRIYEPHKRWGWRADSATRSAIPIMREIDLYNRRIIATMVSRLAMNGLLLIPQEGVIATPAQYQDQDDPFVAMLIEIASNNIRNPGGASASIPIPIRYPSELIEKWKHLTFGDGIDDPLLLARDKAIGRLATTLNMPAEVLKGVGQINHWGQWQLEESGIKLHISPVAETIVGGITVGYLHPMLAAVGQEPVGPNGGKIITWYDTSELTARPDKSAQAQAAYDRLEISGAAYRRESGLDEGDKPTEEELREQVLKKLVALPNAAFQALADLVHDPSLVPPPVPVAGGPQASGPVDEGGAPTGGTPDSPSGPTQPPATGTPTTRNQPPPTGGQPSPQAAAVAAVAARLLLTDLHLTTTPPPVNGHRTDAGRR